MLRLEMLPAAHGDALLLTWGTSRKRRHVLVDGGPLGTYQGIHDRIAALGKKPALELLVVTHIDGDHIEGVIRLLQDRTALKLTVKDTWFNGWPQMPASDLLGPDYGEMVGALLERYELPWNVPWGGGAVVVPDEGPLPSFPLDGGARVTLLGPGNGELRKLRAGWTKVLAEIGVTPGDVDGALERLGRRKDLEGVDLQGGTTKLDSSVANGSSISLLFEYDGRSLLLTGDSHAAPLVAGIKRLLAERGEDRLHVDAFKLPHHCSKANVTDDLLALVDTSRYLVSTNGARYKHPDRAAVLRVLEQPERPDDLELVFNYVSATTSRWTKETNAKKYRYTPVPPETGTGGAVVEV
jgi:hypothetical protein